MTKKKSMADATRNWAKGSLPNWLTPILLAITIYFVQRLITDHERRIKETEAAITAARERVIIIETKLDQVQSTQRETLSEVKIINAYLSQGRK